MPDHSTRTLAQTACTQLAHESVRAGAERSDDRSAFRLIHAAGWWRSDHRPGQEEVHTHE